MPAKEITNYNTIIHIKGEENKQVISKSLEKFIDISEYNHSLQGNREAKTFSIRSDRTKTGPSRK